MGSISKPLLPGYLACVPLSCFPNGNTESIARVKRKREGSPSNLLHLALAMAMVTFRYFSGHFTDAFLPGVTGVFLHVRCIPHQNSQ